MKQQLPMMVPHSLFHPFFIISDWGVFQCVLLQESRLVKKESKSDKEPSLQELKVPGTASVESRTKQIKTMLHNRLNDVNLALLMRIAVEGPELSSVNFDDIREVFK